MASRPAARATTSSAPAWAISSRATSSPAASCSTCRRCCTRCPTRRWRPWTSRTCGPTTPARCGPGRTRSRHASRMRGRSPRPAVLRAYRLYLAGSAMAFEQGWISLHQMLATRPSGSSRGRPDARRTIRLPLQPRVHVPVIYKFKSKAAGDVDHAGAHRRQAAARDRPRAGRQGHHRGRRHARQPSPPSSRRWPTRRPRSSRRARRRGRRASLRRSAKAACRCASAHGRWSR